MYKNVLATPNHSPKHRTGVLLPLALSLLALAGVACSPAAAVPTQAAPVSGQATPADQPNFQLETVCPPTDPGIVLQEIRKRNNFDQPGFSQQIPLGDGRNLEFLVFGKEKITINQDVFIKLMLLAENLQPGDFSFLDHAGTYNPQKRQKIGSGSQIILNSGETPCLDANPLAIAFTANSDRTDLSVSAVSLDKIIRLYGGRDRNALAYAAAAEMLQQSFALTNFNEQLSQESMANGFGIAASTIQGLWFNGTDPTQWYAQYQKYAGACVINIPGGSSKCGILTESAFQNMAAQMMGGLFLTWDAGQ